MNFFTKEKIKVSSYIQRTAKDFTDEELIEEYVDLILRYQNGEFMQLACDFKSTNFNAVENKENMMNKLECLKGFKKELRLRNIENVSAKILDRYNEVVIDHMNKYFREEE